MFSRTFTFLAIAAFALVGTQAHHNHKNHQVEKNIVDEAKKLIEQLKQLVQKEIAAAKQKIEEIVANIKDLAKNKIEEVKQKIQEEYEKLLAEIEQLKEQLGAAVEPCIDEALPTIQGLPEEMLNGLISCVVKQVQEALDIVNSIVADIESLPQIVTKLENDLAACGSLDIVCYTKVAAEATKQLAAIPIDIAEQVQNAEKLIATIQTDLELCAVDQLKQMAERMAGIIKDLVSCATGLPDKPIAH